MKPAANHPWRMSSPLKLAAAKKVAKLRYNAQWKRDHYDDLDRLDARTHYRKTHDIPLDAPKLRATPCVKTEGDNLTIFKS